MTNAEVILHVGEEGAERSELGSIVGEIFFSLDDSYFPERSWTDFMVVIISWWLEALMRIVAGNSRSEELWFMDGPFFVNVIREDETIVTVDCIEDRREKNIIYSANTYLDSLASTLLSGALAIESICRDEKWESEDVAILSSNIKKFKDAFDL